ncbi:MAG: DNA circularization N-terminal domain-containing protein, partial [Pseudolabrys sp.]
MGGRRGPTFEFPKRDDPYSEDMGRRARRRVITGYVIGDDYEAQRDALVRACETEGPGTLVHPSWGAMRMKCDVFSMTERRQHGGIATFELTFAEAGLQSLPIADDTAGLIRQGAAAAKDAIARALDGSAT